MNGLAGSENLVPGSHEYRGYYQGPSGLGLAIDRRPLVGVCASHIPETAGLVYNRGLQVSSIRGSDIPTPLRHTYHAAGQNRIEADADVILELWHDFGSIERGQAASMIGPLRAFSVRNGGEGLYQRVGRMIWDQSEKFGQPLSRLKFSTGASDLPYSGNLRGGSGLNRYKFPHDIQSAMAELVKHLEWLRDQAPQIPRVVLARGASSGIILEINRRYPGLLQGMVLIAPMAYQDKHGWKESNERLEKFIKRGVINPNRPAINWIQRIYPQMTWAQDSLSAFGHTPVLMMYGETDPGSPLSTVDYFQGLAHGSSHAEFVIFKKAGHDPLLSSNFQIYDPTPAYVYIEKFIRKHVLHQSHDWLLAK